MAAEHLTKEQELILGTLVQKSLRAQSLKESPQDTYELDGEVLTPAQLEAVIKDGNQATKSLVDSNTALVWSQARRFKSTFPSAPELEDLVQEGMMGLLTAIKKYDPERGNKLSTVAYNWIDQAIGRSTNKTGRLIRLPENRIANFIEINRIRARYEDSDLTSEQIDEIAMQELGLSRDKFLSITNAANMPVSLNRPVSFDGGETKELMDFVSDKHAGVSSEEQVTNELMMEILYEKLGNLSEMEKAVVSSAFLMGDVVDKRKSMVEVRETYNLTPQKFKRILNNALTKVRGELEGLSIEFGDFLQ